MSDEELREQLARLHEDLEQAVHAEKPGRDALGRLMTDIVTLASGQPLDEESQETLKEHIEHQATDFESRHPRLAEILRDIMDILSKMGI